MIQGQATAGEGGVLEPDFVAANLRQDLEASKAVFAELQVGLPAVAPIGSLVAIPFAMCCVR